MAALFSIPSFPAATGYAVQYADPSEADPNAPNPLGTWETLGTYTVPSNIVDTAGDQNLRLYRAAPIVPINGTPFTYGYSQPFSVAMSDPGSYMTRLYDARITFLLPSFRDFIGDSGTPQTSSTVVDLDSGAGSGLLQPDGTTTVFNLADVPDALPAIVLENSVSVVKNGTTLSYGTDYYCRWAAGQVIFATAPTTEDVITINFTEVINTNRVLNQALANAVEHLGSLGISGYGTTYDNNVINLQISLGDTGLRYIVFYAAQKVLNHATIWAKAQGARSYKSGDFSMDTVPDRVLEGMSAQTQVEFAEIQNAVYKFNRANTRSVSYGDYDSFFDLKGLLPTWSVVYVATQLGYWV